MRILDTTLKVCDVFCNKCGMSCRSEGSTTLDADYNGVLDIEVVGTYHSTHVPDGEVHKFDLCERCFMELQKTFVRYSYIGNYMNASYIRPGFDRHKYYEKGKVLWEDLSDEEKTEVMTTSEIMLSWVSEMPKDQLVLSLYEFENENDKNIDRSKIIAKIKEVLQEDRHKNFK